VEETILSTSLRYLCLFYLRHLPTFEILGLQFGISKTSANDIFHYLVKKLREIVPASLLEQVRNQTSDYEVVQELLTEFELLVDSTEQDRERQAEYKEQKFFSGKKKNIPLKISSSFFPKHRSDVLGRCGPAKRY